MVKTCRDESFQPQTAFMTSNWKLSVRKQGTAWGKAGSETLYVLRSPLWMRSPACQLLNCSVIYIPVWSSFYFRAFIWATAFKTPCPLPKLEYLAYVSLPWNVFQSNSNIKPVMTVEAVASTSWHSIYTLSWSLRKRKLGWDKKPCRIHTHSALCNSATVFSWINMFKWAK